MWEWLLAVVFSRSFESKRLKNDIAQSNRCQNDNFKSNWQVSRSWQWQSINDELTEWQLWQQDRSRGGRRSIEIHGGYLILVWADLFQSRLHVERINRNAIVPINTHKCASEQFNLASPELTFFQFLHPLRSGDPVSAYYKMRDNIITFREYLGYVHGIGRNTWILANAYLRAPLLSAVQPTVWRSLDYLEYGFHNKSDLGNSHPILSVQLNDSPISAFTNFVRTPLSALADDCRMSGWVDNKWNCMLHLLPQ